MLATTALLLTLFTVLASEDEFSEEQLLALTQRCGEEVSWHRQWSSAAEKAHSRGALILVLHQAQAGYEMPDAARTGPLMDPDTVPLVQQRFEIFEYTPGVSAPFVDQERYGVGPLSFGASFLVADTEGNILDTTGDMGGTFFAFLVRNIARLPVGKPPKHLNRAGKAAWHLQRGELEASRALLAQPENAEEYRVIGTVQRLKLEGYKALQAYDKAVELGGAEMAAEVAVEKALVHRGLEQRTLARGLLNSVEEDHPDWLQAQFQLGSLDLAAGDLEEALGHYGAIIQQDPEHRWAWIAGAMTLYAPLYVSMSAGISLAWPDREAFDMNQPPTWSPLPAARLDHAEHTAFDYLLSTQRADGSWTMVSSAAERLVDPFIIATTAWGGRALLEHLDHPRTEAALRRAVGFLRASRHRLAETGEPFGAMDYFVWSKPSLLLFGAEGILAGVLDEDEWLPLLDQNIEELRTKQRKGGGWHYYKGFDLENLDDSLEMSASFVTAYALLALKACQEAGADVPDDMVDGALRCLQACSNSDGTFEYTLVHATEQAPRVMTPSGAAGRGPLCSLALWRWGLAELDDVEASVQHFLKHRDAFAREHGKTLMHCGLEGEGSHYLMFDYAWCSAAFSELDEVDRSDLSSAAIEVDEGDEFANQVLEGGGFDT
jgi:tetratricopeptide (TPR) repeat protein